MVSKLKVSELKVSELKLNSIEPNYKILVNNSDVTNSVRKYLVSLQITDNDKDDADELTLTLSAKFKRPSNTDNIKVFLGYGNELKFAGLFTIQTTSIRDNRQLTIKATGADFNGDLKQRRNLTYPPLGPSNKTITLASVVKKIASRYQLEVKTDIDINGRFEQENESDLNFLNRLAKEYNAIFNIKNTTLYFMQKGGEVPRIFIDINKCLSSNISYSNKTLYKSCKAIYHNTKLNKKAEVVTGSGKPQLIKEGQWKNDNDALLSARNALTRANKNESNGNLTTRGQVIFAGSKLTLDDEVFQINKVTHNLSKGWKTTLNFKGFTIQ